MKPSASWNIWQELTLAVVNSGGDSDGGLGRSGSDSGDAPASAGGGVSSRVTA